MTQQLVIKTSDKDSLKGLVESALEREKKLLQASIDKTRARLAEFEERFGMSSMEFEKKLKAGEIKETPSVTEWRMEIGMLQLLERKCASIEESSIVD
jgi:DNA-binding NtrC family response regulator